MSPQLNVVAHIPVIVVWEICEKSKLQITLFLIYDHYDL